MVRIWLKHRVFKVFKSGRKFLSSAFLVGSGTRKDGNFEKDDLKFFVPACPNNFLSRCGEISLQPSQGALFYGRGCSAGCEDNFDCHEDTASALSGYAGQCENPFDDSVHSSEDTLGTRVAALPVRQLDVVSPAARCGENSFTGHLLDFGNSLLASESGYSLHCLNSPNSLIRHPSMHAPSLARELVVGRGGIVGAVGCREGEVVHVHRCDEDDACMDDVNSVIQGYESHATACSSLDALPNSRWARGHCLRGGTKCSSMGSRDQVWLSDESKDSFSHQEPQSLHVEAWAGLQGCPPQEGFQVREFLAGCASVSFPVCSSVLTSVLPGPGSENRKQLGWTQLEKTEKSGVWFFRGAFQRDDLFSSLAETVDWEWKGSYQTAWAVLGGSSCSCSYAYGHGTAIGPHTGMRCKALLSFLWRTYVAPLMKPWCAEGEVPSAANLNFYRGRNSRVSWHSDDEPLFGGSGVHKLIVSVSFGASALFKWKGKSCLDSVERSCWLDHGDILVMDGQCQDEFLHCTSPGLECGRINVTYRWVVQHTHFCSLFKAGMVCCLPTCAKGSSVHVMGNLGYGCFWAFLFLPCVLCTLGVIGWASYLLWCSGLGSFWCAFFRFRSLGVGRFGHYLLDLGEDNGAAHNTVPLFLSWVFVFVFGLCVYWEPYMLAILRQPSLHGYYACLVFWAKGALWRNCRLKQCETSFSPSGVFLCSRYSLKRWWGKVLWLLWVGRARHPGPFSGSMSVEVFNVGGWLTHGDLALETEVDFLAVVEHRLVPARVRSEWARLRARGASSVWSPASQESSHVGHGGVGVVSLKGAPLSLPTSATAQFKRFFDCGRALRCLLPVASGRFLHLVVLYGYQGADGDAEQLSLTEQLFDAALGELRVVALDQPCLLVGDFNVEPTKIPCLSKGILAGLWVDLESAWAFASGVPPAATCKRSWGDVGGHRRDFMVGCPLVAAAVHSCSVRMDRWIVPHLAVQASFLYSSWTCQVSQPVKRTPLWPASWLPALDKTRGSKSVEVQRVWEIYDERLQFMSREDGLGLSEALLCGDVSRAWMIWSSAAEKALADAFQFAGGPVPAKGLVLGRGVARMRTVRLGGPLVRSVKRSAVGDGEFDDVSLYRDSSAAPVLDLRRNLKAILDLLDSVIRFGASLARDVQLLHLWDSVVRLGSLGSVRVEEYFAARDCGVVESRNLVAELYGRVSAFVKGLVAHRRSAGITAWRNWLREDPLVHPYKWLRADLVPPSPFLQCHRGLTPGGSGVLADPARIDEEFRKAWLPYFCRSGQRETSLDEFNSECDGWLPLLGEFSLPALTGDMLFEVVKRKSATAGSLDGWGWRELKVLPVAWFDNLARILAKVEELGVWPDGLLDAYITMIPKVDGDATPLGQRPLSVLPVVYRIWASARMIQLEPWFRSWVPPCVFSAGGGRSSVQAWFTTALDIEEVLSGIVEGDVHIFVADVIKSFDTVDRGILDRVLSSLGLPGWFRHAYFEFHSLVRLRFKLAAGLGQSWTRDGGIPQGCPLSMMFIVALYLPWCRYLASHEGVQPQLYADNLKCISRDPGVLLRAARFTTGYVRLVGQEPAPRKCVFLSTSRVVRRDMKDWVVTDEGDRWTVKLDVRDLGGHLDTTFRGWSSTLATRVRVAIARLVVVFALPLHFHGRLGILRSMFIPGALHGIEASFLAGSGIRKLRSAFARVAWSRRQPFAHVGAVLSLLDGPVGCDPAFCVVWFRFRQMRRYLAFCPEEVHRVYRLLSFAAGGSSGHGPAHLLLESAAEIGFSWCSRSLGWERPGLPVLSMIDGPVQYFRSAILDAWRHKVSVDLCARKGFRGGPFLDISGTLQLLNSDHVRERDKALLRGVLVGGVWNGFLLGKVRNSHVPCRFCGGEDHDGHLFWECTFPPLVEIRENPEFHDLMEMDKSFWPRCLLWHGWLPLLSGANLGSPWAGDLSHGAGNLLECALGSYSSSPLLDWRLPVGFDAEAAALQVAPEPDVWTDGSLVEDRLSTVSSSGAGFSTGHGVLGVKLMMAIRGTRVLLVVVGTVLFLAPCSQFNGLSCGGLFLLCKPLVVCI